MPYLIEANISFLDQADRLLSKVEDSQYDSRVESFYGSTVGQHLRHCLDHYGALLDGLKTTKVNYDHRPRDPGLENSTECALAEVSRVRNRLKAISSHELPVEVHVKMDNGEDGDEWQASTFGRELQFLISHTVHHFAMIGGLCSCLGIEREEGFGIAPSTLKHRELQAR